MPIPAFTIDGILPPFIGASGPGGAAQEMTPYAASALEVAQRFGASDQRRAILRGWLDYRSELRAAGIVRGFQWLDGSFVEKKQPNDMDVVTLFRRPAHWQTQADVVAWLGTNGHLFDRGVVKARFMLDAFPIDLNGDPEVTVGSARYYLGLFSHRRGDGLWKGMVEVRLEDPADDTAALAAIGGAAAGSAVGASP